MGKNPKPLLPDDDGYVSSGIYSYFAGTEESHPEEHESNLKYCSRSLLESVDEMFDRVEHKLNEIIEQRRQELATDETLSSDLVLGDAASALMLLQTVRGMASLPVEELATRQGFLPKQFVHYLFQLGELFELVQVRKHEPAVYARKISDSKLKELNSKRDRKKLKLEAELALAKAKKSHPNKGLTVQKKKAAETVGLKLRAFEQRLKF